MQRFARNIFFMGPRRYLDKLCGLFIMSCYVVVNYDHNNSSEVISAGLEEQIAADSGLFI